MVRLRRVPQPSDRPNEGPSTVRETATTRGARVGTPSGNRGDDGQVAACCISFAPVREEARRVGDRAAPHVLDVSSANAEPLELRQDDGAERYMGALSDEAAHDHGFGRARASSFGQSGGYFFGDFVAVSPRVGSDGAKDVLGTAAPSNP